MFLKKSHLFFLIVFIIIIIFAIIFYFVIPFVEGNNLITYANNNKIGNIENSEIISISDYKKLQIVDEGLISENNFISIKTKRKISLQAINKFSIVYDIRATIDDSESLEKIAEYQTKREIIFCFKNFKWIVESVNII